MRNSLTIAKYNLAKAIAALWKVVLDLASANSLEVRSTVPLFCRQPTCEFTTNCISIPGNAPNPPVFIPQGH